MGHLPGYRDKKNTVSRRKFRHPDPNKPDAGTGFSNLTSVFKRHNTKIFQHFLN